MARRPGAQEPAVAIRLNRFSRLKKVSRLLFLGRLHVQKGENKCGIHREDLIELKSWTNAGVIKTGCGLVSTTTNGPAAVESTYPCSKTEVLGAVTGTSVVLNTPSSYPNSRKDGGFDGPETCNKKIS